MAEKVSRSNPAGTKTPLDVASLDQVKAGKVVIELADGSDAVLGTVEQIISGLVEESVANLLRQKTIDLEYQGNETWATSTGTNNLSVLRGSVDAATINAISDWAASYDIPSGTEIDGAIVVRLAKGENPNDYRLFNGIGLLNIGDFLKISFITSQTYDYYVTTLAFTGRYAVGETIVLQHHGEDGHSIFHGSAPEIETQIQDVRDDVAGKADKVAFDFDFGKHSFTRPILPQKFTIYFKNIDATLLPDGTTQIRIIMRGGTIEIAPVPTEENSVIEVEISATEATNITNTLGNRTTLDIQFAYLNADDAEVGRSPIYLLPITDSTTKWNRHQLLAFSLTRTNAESIFVLPEAYINWNMLMVFVRQNMVETHIAIPIEILTATATITEFGTGNREISWDRATRTIQENGNDATVIIHAMLI